MLWRKSNKMKNMIHDFRNFCETWVRVLQWKLWKEVEFLIVPTLDGDVALRDPEALSSKGGLFIAIGPLFSLFLTNHGSLGSSRGVWCTFIHPSLGSFGIINIYSPIGPNNQGARCTLWQGVFQALDNKILWLCLSNLNMIERIEDQMGGTASCISGREKRAWERIRRKYQFINTFEHKSGQLRFMWDTKRMTIVPVGSMGPNNQRIFRCLDRCYAPVSSILLQFKVVSHVMAGYSFSNHQPVLITGNGDGQRKHPSKYKMNTSQLKDV